MKKTSNIRGMAKTQREQSFVEEPEERMRATKNIAELLPGCIPTDDGAEGTTNRAFRAAEVERKYVAAIQQVYGDKADFVLKHTNAVYIMSDDEGKSLTIYTDDSLVKTDLDNRQELIKIALYQQGEQIERYRLFSSRGSMKARALSVKAPEITEETTPEPAPLTEAQTREIAETAEIINNTAVKHAFTDAMTAKYAAEN